MLKKKTAYEIYTTERLNCAQSILKGYQDEFEIPEEQINEFRAFGGGRAEENSVRGTLCRLQSDSRS